MRSISIDQEIFVHLPVIGQTRRHAWGKTLSILSLSRLHDQWCQCILTSTEVDLGAQNGEIFEMIQGIDRLRIASRLIQKEPDGSMLPLMRGASEIWSAMFDLPSWPTPLREKAIEIQSSLFRYGTIQMTIDQMVEPERLQLKRDLLQFVELAEQLNGSDGQADGHGIPEADGRMHDGDGRMHDGNTFEHPR